MRRLESSRVVEAKGTDTLLRYDESKSPHMHFNSTYIRHSSFGRYPRLYIEFRAQWHTCLSLRNTSFEKRRARFHTMFLCPSSSFLPGSNDITTRLMPSPAGNQITFSYPHELERRRISERNVVLSYCKCEIGGRWYVCVLVVNASTFEIPHSIQMSIPQPPYFLCSRLSTPPFVFHLSSLKFSSSGHGFQGLSEYPTSILTLLEKGF
jgi:hypothetical protein